MNNYKIANLGSLKNIEREMIMGKVGSTGCEVSITTLKKGTGFPFIHSHKLNEEVYIIARGKGLIYLDGKEIQIEEGSVIRVDPEVKRGLFAEEELHFICIQAEKNSLTQATREDGIINKDKSSWL